MNGKPYQFNGSSLSGFGGANAISAGNDQKLSSGSNTASRSFWPFIPSAAAIDTPTNLTVAEDELYITTITATTDAPIRSFDITGGADQFMFRLNSLTGELSFASTKDFESPDDGNGIADGTYEVDIEVSDTDNSTASLTFSVALTDVDPDPVLSDTRSVFNNKGELFLGGRYMKLSISQWGDFGHEWDPPESFLAPDDLPIVRLAYDPDGFGEGTRPRTDFLYGDERFVVGFDDGQRTSTSNSAMYGQKSMFTTVENQSSGSLLKAKVKSVWSDNMLVQQEISFDENKAFIRNEVTLTNISGVNWNSARYMRSINPGNTFELGGLLSTENEVLFSHQSGDDKEVVVARTFSQIDPALQAASSRQPLFFYSKDARVRVSSFGVRNTDPYASAAYDNTLPKGQKVISDSSITITFESGALNDGQSAKFVYYTSLDERSLPLVMQDIQATEHADDASPIIDSLSIFMDKADVNGTTTQVSSAVSNGSGYYASNAYVAGNGLGFSFTPIIFNPQGEVLTFSIENKPSWANFNPNTGELSGTPIKEGNHPNIKIRVTGAPSNNEDYLTPFSIIVIGNNDSPTLAPEIFYGDEFPTLHTDEYYGFSFTPELSDGNQFDIHSFQVTNLPSWAEFDTTTGMISGYPEEDDVGTYSNIIISVQDGLRQSTGTLGPFDIVVEDVFAQGTFADRVLVTSEDTALHVANPHNGQDFVLEYYNGAPPKYGTLLGLPDRVTYAPGVNYHGNDQFTYITWVGEDIYFETNVSFSVISLNDPPEARSLNLSTSEERSVSFTIKGYDPDYDHLTYIIVTAPQNGVLSGTPPTLIYTPNENFVGDDSFTFKVNDGNLDSATATVSIVTTGVNDAPVANSQTIELEEDTQATIILDATDAEGDSLSYKVISSPAHGVLTGNAPDLVYTPNGNFFGNDSFTFVVNDGSVDSEIATINLVVIGVNDAPVSQPQSIQTPEDTPATINLEAFDPDGDALTYQFLTLPEKGELIGLPPNLTYQPRPDINGNDSFTYTVSDNVFTTDIVTINIVITAVNDAPTVVNDEVTVEQDSINNLVNVLLNDSDIDGDNLTLQSATAQKGNAIVTSDGRLLYTPTPEYSGTDTIAYMISDNHGGTGSGTVFVTINEKEVNLPPIAVEDNLEFTTFESVIIDVLSNDTDPENDELKLLNAASDSGSIEIIQQQIQFTPNADVGGDVSIQYSIADTAGNTASGLVNLRFFNADAPVITSPPDLCDEAAIHADSLYTRIDVGLASAVDRFGNAVPVSKVDGVRRFPPGKNRVKWKATDNEGNASTLMQNVCVMPLVSFAKDQTVTEGQRAIVTVHLNGKAPKYPVSIPYSVSGTANAADHDLTDGILVLEQGTSGKIHINIKQDEVDENEEFILLTLSDTVNVGEHKTHKLTIVEGNVAPQTKLKVSQVGEERFQISKEDDYVDIRALVKDANENDKHFYQWQVESEDFVNNSLNDDIYRFDPESLAPGLYTISLTVSDDGEPVKTNQSSVFIEVVEQLQPLENVDSDGDLISDIEEGYGDKDADGIPDYLDRIQECNVLPEQVSTHDGYLIESQPGTCLRRGEYTYQGETGGAQLNYEDIANINTGLVADDVAVDVGGIFDYIAYGLPVSGTDFAVVTPQRNPIPEDSILRKFSVDKGWYTFVEDDHNSLWSSAGEPGYCPPPDTEQRNGSVWTPGMTPGHWCVMSVIQDGGPNDSDGVVNGTIVDIGFVGVQAGNFIMPIAVDDVAEVVENHSVTIDVLANDSAPDDGVLTITSALSDIGTVTIDEQSLLYTPPQDYVGEDEIVYGINLIGGGSAQAKVLITIIANAAPQLEDDYSDVVQGESITVNLLNNDSDPEQDSFILKNVDHPDVSFSENGQATFTASSNFIGEITIEYGVEDSHGNSSAGHWHINVTQAPPVVSRTSGGGSLNLWLLLLLFCIAMMVRLNYSGERQ
ncbi:tandem-95 repeat protein [Paraneptunicella aestuarii]|uniref:Ig-like domain-containing protein n=1 Tax=Paraneptunicella aestuarii TaxID=2831148 RepID=UPI001E5E4504|nr:Ig-like domain-containing protein [Paraneptunicella aestuarii]UAA39160.1 tandem-95 repeat protein [Paraneptunicella aestuarii]